MKKSKHYKNQPRAPKGSEDGGQWTKAAKRAVSPVTLANKELKRRGQGHIKLVRGRGYYYFHGLGAQGSIYADDLTGFTTDEILSNLIVGW